ncbi:hypothetical protein JXC34_05285 [Candidatus Woesearchaeota archaeon]|nr:hypothetical protein [Candidatus Woesearchaeota archaeon]
MTRIDQEVSCTKGEDNPYDPYNLLWAANEGLEKLLNTANKILPDHLKYLTPEEVAERNEQIKREWEQDIEDFFMNTKIWHYAANLQHLQMCYDSIIKCLDQDQTPSYDTIQEVLGLLGFFSQTTYEEYKKFVLELFDAFRDKWVEKGVDPNYFEAHNCLFYQIKTTSMNLQVMFIPLFEDFHDFLVNSYDPEDQEYRQLVKNLYSLTSVGFLLGLDSKNNYDSFREYVKEPPEIPLFQIPMCELPSVLQYYAQKDKSE